MNRPTEIWQGGGLSEAKPDSADDLDSRSLNVHFNYNGHSWDAFEVLGLPAGSSVAGAEQAYKDAIAKVDPRAREFYDHALAAIRRHQT
jgi:hypothetical protein